MPEGATYEERADDFAVLRLEVVNLLSEHMSDLLVNFNHIEDLEAWVLSTMNDVIERFDSTAEDLLNGTTTS